MIEETIVAIATPPGQGGVAIVRLSGPASARCLQRLHSRGSQEWESHRLYYGALLRADGQELDRGLAVWMKEPRSYTGEDVVEFHLHGGPALAQWMVQSCLELGARLARPGEFTQRAFLNGKLDLSQAEAVQQLIQSQGRLAAQLAQRNLQGLFSDQVARLRSQALDWLALLEAEIDFGDEVPGLPFEESRRRLRQLGDEIQRLLAQGQAGKLLSDGLRLVIVGAPNAGKSTLLNTLLGRQRALVTPIAGTTRDTLEETLVVAGVPLVVVDTAGVREQAGDLVEQLGIERSLQEAEQADLILRVIDASLAEKPPELPGLTDSAVLTLLNKVDLTRAEWSADFPSALSISLASGAGLTELWEELEGQVRERASRLGDGIRLTQRQWEALERARQALDRVQETLLTGLSAEFVALDLRAAAQALGEIQGIDVTEEVLDRIFSTFCLGK